MNKTSNSESPCGGGRWRVQRGYVYGKKKKTSRTGGWLYCWPRPRSCRTQRDERINFPLSFLPAEFLSIETAEKLYFKHFVHTLFIWRWCIALARARTHELYEHNTLSLRLFVLKCNIFNIKQSEHYAVLKYSHNNSVRYCQIQVKNS